MKIAVVGAGISGLAAAWHLSRSHEVVLFEALSRIGGHAHTRDVPIAGASQTFAPVDTGFIVYNEQSYPNLVALFDHLDVPTAATEMSFAVSLGQGALEYSGSGPGGLFGQRRNVLRPSHWQMCRDLLRFFEIAKAEAPAPDKSLGDWLREHGFSDPFIERHIKPMGAAIWSTPAERILDFPAGAFLRFFDNHGLLKVRDRPKWRTVRGGSREYVTRLLADMDVEVRSSAAVVSISRTPVGSVLTTSDGTRAHFDACVIATHADEALAMLADADERERGLLAPFAYTDNAAVLHTDAQAMPKRRRLWSSWNYTGGSVGTALATRNSEPDLSVTYWMNSLQPLITEEDWFVTLNPAFAIREDLIHSTQTYRHPVFDRSAMEAQRDLWSLQGQRRTWFCGSYFAFGFHEDGLQSGLAAAEDLSGRPRPWSLAGMNDRLSLPDGWSPGRPRDLAVAAA